MKQELLTIWSCRFQAVREIAARYGLDTERVDRILAELPDFHVTTPLIGGFSTGKSSLLNALLGEELLAVDITPETAIPAELSYGPDGVVCLSPAGARRLSLAEYRAGGAPAGTTLVQIHLEHPALAAFPNVRLVDMPGFDSGIELHNRAIDDYMSRSLAYLITVAADEGTLRESILRFLKELKLNDMPAFFLLTKADKVLPEELEEIRSHIAATAAAQLGLPTVETGITNAEDGDAAALTDCLAAIEAQSEKIFEEIHSSVLRAELSRLRKYLESSLNKMDRTAEQLEADRRESEEKIAELERELARKNEDFESRADACIGTICGYAERALSDARDGLVDELARGNQIGERINFIVRSAITNGLHAELEPMMQRYIRDVSAMAQLQIPDLSGGLLTGDEKAANSKMKEGLKSLVDPVSKAAGSAVGAILGTVLCPGVGTAIGAVVGTLLGTLLSSGIDRAMMEKEMEQRRKVAGARVDEVIRSVMSEASANVRAVVRETADKVRDSLAGEIGRTIAEERKVLSERMEKLQQSAEQRAAEGAQMQHDLKVLEEIAV